MLASTQMLLRHFSYIANMAFTEGVKCPAFQLLHGFDCAKSTLHFQTLHFAHFCVAIIKYLRQLIYNENICGYLRCLVSVA